MAAVRRKSLGAECPWYFGPSAALLELPGLVIELASIVGSEECHAQYQKTSIQFGVFDVKMIVLQFFLCCVSNVLHLMLRLSATYASLPGRRGKWFCPPRSGDGEREVAGWWWPFGRFSACVAADPWSQWSFTTLQDTSPRVPTAGLIQIICIITYIYIYICLSHIQLHISSINTKFSVQIVQSNNLVYNFTQNLPW